MKQRLERLVALTRTPAGRAVAVLVGVGGVALIVRHLGVAAVVHAVQAGAALFPVVLALEMAFVTCTMIALRSLYGEAGRAVPAGQLARAGLVGYAIAGLVPAGRAVAEVTRAAMLARFVGTRRAATAAFQMQGVVLLSNTVVSAACTLSLWLAVGPSLMTFAIAGNMAVTGALGGTLLYLGRHPGMDSWIARHVARADQREAAASEGALPLPWRALAWEVAGRSMQILQNAVLVVAVGGSFGLRPALASEALHLVGVAVGELVPAQLGFTEANYTLGASAVGLPAASAVAIALLAHIAQLVWVAVGSLVPLVWPARPAPAPDVVAAAAPLPPAPEASP